MPWDLFTTVYELKGNLSQFIRALRRGDADCIVVLRYKRPVACLIPIGGRKRPALEPETAADRAMRARTVWDAKTDLPSRRPPPVPDIFGPKR